MDLVLGRDFLKKHQCSVELGERNFLCVNQSGLIIPLGTGNESYQEASIAVIATETPCNPQLCDVCLYVTSPFHHYHLYMFYPHPGLSHYHLVRSLPLALV